MRCPFRIQEITMRRAHFLAPLWLAALAASSPAARAQAHDGHHPPTSSSTADRYAQQTSAIDPAAPSLPLRHSALPASGAIETELTDWRQANAAVAQFPNGHMDILRWEATQAGQPARVPAPHGTHQPQRGQP
jgi:hypothetical protein